MQKDVTNNFYTGYTPTGNYIDNYRIKLFNTAAYAQYEIKPAEPLRIVMGLRYDRIHYNFTQRHRRRQHQIQTAGNKRF
jgi:iron complex outermembrane receptor protein